jgi:hypothetical protein
VGVSTCSVTETATSAGSRTISASYPASAVHQSSGGSNQLTVNQAATTTSAASSVNPSVFGQPVTFTATVAVTAPGAGALTGTVTFADGATALGTVPLSGATATFTTSALAAGAHAITAAYGGGTNFKSSTSAVLVQVVIKAGSATTLVSSLNPSILGQAVTFTATVGSTPPGASGLVTFTDAGVTIGSAALVGGAAGFTTSTLAIGGHPIAAIYGGDGNFSASGSATLTQVVQMPPYTFSGFGSPLATAGTLSAPTFSGNSNLGNAVPIKWQLFDTSGHNVTDLTSTTILKAVSNTTCSGTPTGPETLLYAPTVGATGGSTFRSSSSGFIFNWDTSSVVPNGPGCYTLVLQLNDGSAPRATTVRLQ